MKSLGDLLPKTSGVQQVYQELLSEPEIAKTLKRYESQIDMAYLPSFISDLDEYLRNKGKCEGCPGLDSCKQPVKGHYPRLEPRYNQLKVSYTPCQYQLNHRHLDNIKSFHMAMDISKADFDQFIMDPERAEIHERALMFIHEYLTTKQGRGLYIYGSFGTGKTYMLSAIANTLSKMGVVCGLVYFPELIAEIKSGFGSDSSSAYDKIEQLKNIEVLMLDDIGSESMTSWMRDEVLGRILNYRMHKGLPTFFTSNNNYDQLQHHYTYSQKGEVEEMKGARILERIKALTIPVELQGTNYRQKL